MLIVAVKQVHSDAGFCACLFVQGGDMPFHRPLGQEQAVGYLLGAAVRGNHLGEHIHSRSVSPYFAMNASLRSSSDFWEAGGSLGSLTAFMRAVYTAITTLTATNSTRAMTMAGQAVAGGQQRHRSLAIRAALTLFMARPMPPHSDGRRICRESSIKPAVKKTTKKPEDR